MILLLGSSGYIGSAFAAELRHRSIPFRAVSRKELDYTQFNILWKHLKENRPSFIINAAGFTGKPNVDACETARAETLLGNTLFPQTLAQACLATGIPYGHVSSGCIYSGAKIVENGVTRIERDLTLPVLREIVETELRTSYFGLQPSCIRGFTELDPPNFSFRCPPCSFYSGTKALAEEAMLSLGNGYLWRLRIPFDEFDSPRNYLTKVQTYTKVYDNVNSISNRREFVQACLDLWELRSPFGAYNITNPGWITTRYVVSRIQAILKPTKQFEFWQDDAEFYRFAKTPRSNCIMDTTKLLAAGIKMRPIDEALDQTLKTWVSGGSPQR